MSTQPTPNEQQQADRVDAVYKAWLAGGAALPDDELDPALAATAERVAQRLAAPGPDPEFGAALRDRLQAAAAQPRPTERRFVFSARPWRVAAALALAALLGVYLLSLRPAPVSAQEIVRRAGAALASPAAAGLQSYFLVEQSTLWAWRNGDAAGEPPIQSRGEMRRWFQAPNRWRMELQGQFYAANGQPAGNGSWNSITVSDGSSQYDYDAAANTVSINVAAADQPGAESSGASSLAQLFERMATCYRPQVSGSAEVAGQPVYVVDLGPTLCPSASAPEANGREVIWVDKNTFFVLKHELHSTKGDQLLLRREVTEVQYNPALDAALFIFTPPAGARVVDYRPQALSTAATVEGGDANGAQSALLDALQPLAQGADFPLFAPSTIPQDLAPRQPKLMPLSDTLDQLQIELLPAETVAEDVYAGEDGIVITQQAADYATVVSFTQKATPVLLPGETEQASDVRAWARRGFTDVYGTGSDSGVIVLRDGVLISLNSFAYGPEELLALAADLQPVPGGHAALPNPQPPTLAEVRASAPFAFFVPTWVPAGLTAEPPVGYTITYHDRSGQPVLTVTNGTGLADDPRYAGEGVTLSNRLAAHWLGSLLWWVQDGTPLAISSESLSREEMLRVAASMSSSAELGVVALPPQPTPAPVLPTPTPMPTPAFAVLRPTWLPEEMNVREQVEGDTVSMGFTPATGNSQAALVLVQTPARGDEGEIADPQASSEQIGSYNVTVIRRGAEGCVTYTWETAGLRLTLTNVYDPPGTLKYSCEQMRRIVAGIH